VGRSKMKTFEGIQSRVRKKLDGWKERFLSQAGKEILLKAVVQTIPTYSMSVHLPVAYETVFEPQSNDESVLVGSIG
jgi:hypothetical protein